MVSCVSGFSQVVWNKRWSTMNSCAEYINYMLVCHSLIRVPLTLLLCNGKLSRHFRWNVDDAPCYAYAANVTINSNWCLIECHGRKILIRNLWRQHIQWWLESYFMGHVSDGWPWFVWYFKIPSSIQVITLSLSGFGSCIKVSCCDTTCQASTSIPLTGSFV